MRKSIKAHFASNGLQFLLSLMHNNIEIDLGYIIFKHNIPNKKYNKYLTNKYKFSFDFTEAVKLSFNTLTLNDLMDVYPHIIKSTLISLFMIIIFSHEINYFLHNINGYKYCR